MLKIRSWIFLLIFLLTLSVSPFASQPGQAAKAKQDINERERQIKLDGQPNFRDLGGYGTKDGRRVKRGLIYRREENERELKNIRDNIAKQRGIPPEQVDITICEGMFLVKPEYLDAAHDEVVRRYGSMESYLRKGLGIPDEMIAKLRSELLE